MNEVVDLLPDRESEIIRRRFGWYGGEPQPLNAVGEAFKPDLHSWGRVSGFDWRLCW